MKNLQVYVFVLIVMLSLVPLTAEDNTGDPLEEYLKIQEKHEREHPVFLQKGGMLRVNEHSFYVRTNDEWTGFSTVLAGYRYGVSEAFNIAIEGGASPIPYVFIAAILLHFKLYETPNKFFFLGMRIRFGYKYQLLDFSEGGHSGIVFQDYMESSRNGLYLIGDLTAAFRFGKYRRFCLYYTIYPRVEFDFFDMEDPVYFLFSPVMAGFEVRFPKKRMRWSFAVEGGYVFPIPWDSIPTGKWINFPCLANISFNYRFGDKFYSKENLKQYGIDLKELTIMNKRKKVLKDKE